MSIELQSKKRIDAIISACNEKTGGAALDLTSAVQSLADGYGQGGGSDELALSILDRSITEFKNDNVATLGVYAFAYSENLTEVDLSNCERFGVVSTNGYQFYRCSKLSSVRAPLLTNVPAYAFNGTALESYYLPNVTLLGSACFASSLIKEAVFLLVTTMSSHAFSNCAELEYADFAKISTISAYDFQNCPKLKKIVLRNANLCALANINAFTGTPFASSGTGGTVYVPQALIEEYKTATNWSSLHAAGTCNFAAIEGSEYE